MIAIIWEYVAIFILFYFVAWLATLVLALFIFAYSLTKDWKRDLRMLKKMAKTKKSDADIYERLIEFIRSHSNVKKLSELVDF